MVLKPTGASESQTFDKISRGRFFDFSVILPVFAVQNGGACFSGPDGEQTYKRYGKSDACKSGKGGPFANNVYKTFDDGELFILLLS